MDPESKEVRIHVESSEYDELINFLTRPPELQTNGSSTFAQTASFQDYHLDFNSYFLEAEKLSSKLVPAPVETASSNRIEELLLDQSTRFLHLYNTLTVLCNLTLNSGSPKALLTINDVQSLIKQKGQEALLPFQPNFAPEKISKTF